VVSSTPRPHFTSGKDPEGHRGLQEIGRLIYSKQSEINLQRLKQYNNKKKKKKKKKKR